MSGGPAFNAERASASLSIMSGGWGYKLTWVVRIHNSRWGGCWECVLEVDGAGSGFATAADMVDVGKRGGGREEPFSLSCQVSTDDVDRRDLGVTGIVEMAKVQILCGLGVVSIYCGENLLVIYMRLIHYRRLPRVFATQGWGILDFCVRSASSTTIAMPRQEIPRTSSSP